MKGLHAEWVRLLGLGVLLTTLSSSVEGGPPPEPGILRVSSTEPFQDVIDEIELAISEHNFRITGRNTLGAGIRERGYKHFPNVEVIHFCSLEYARQVLELDPGFVAYMPCRIAVHEQGDRVIVNAVLLPERHPDERVAEFARKMNRLIREIVRSALREPSLE